MVDNLIPWWKVYNIYDVWKTSNKNVCIATKKPWGEMIGLF